MKLALRTGALMALSLLALSQEPANAQGSPPCTDDSCCLKIVKKKDGKIVKIHQRGKSIMGSDAASTKKRAAVDAGIAMVRLGETVCGVDYPGTGDSPAADDLEERRNRGDICEVDKEGDPENTGTGTSDVQQDVSTDNGVNVTNFDGINIDPDTFPTAYDTKEQAEAEGGIAIPFGGKFYEAGYLVNFASNLIHELTHRDDTESSSTAEREDKATKVQIDFLCKLCDCSALFNGDPPPQFWKDMICQKIAEVNKARCEKWRLPPVSCPCCHDEQNPPEPCPDSEGQEGNGGGQSGGLALAGYPTGKFVTEEIFLERHFGHVRLDVSSRKLTWTLTHKANLVRTEVVADWTEPTPLRDNFYPTAFCMLQDDIAIVTGIDALTGEGVLLAMTLNIATNGTMSQNERPVYAGFGFSNVISVDSVDNAAAVVMLDTLTDQVVWMDLRTAAMSVLADGTDDPRIGTAKYVHAGRHYLPGRDLWVGLSVTVSDIPIEYTDVTGSPSFFSYLIADTNGDGLIDTKEVLTP